VLYYMGMLTCECARTNGRHVEARVPMSSRLQRVVLLFHSQAFRKITSQ